MNEIICDAIRARKLLMFGYADLLRVVEPHAYGLSGADRELLSGWLWPGHSRSDPKGGWRNYLVEQIRDLQLLNEVFEGPRPGYNPRDERLARVFCRLGEEAGS